MFLHSEWEDENCGTNFLGGMFEDQNQLVDYLENFRRLYKLYCTPAKTHAESFCIKRHTLLSICLSLFLFLGLCDNGTEFCSS
jgi:hypothetical protein